MSSRPDAMPAVDVHDLSVVIQGKPILQDLTFEVPAGCYVAVLGPNGAGKTTLLKVLLGLVSPTKGHVRLDGTSNLREQSSTIGHVPQLKTMDRRFPARSVDLVISGKRRAWPWSIRPAERQTACEALEQVGAGHLADRSLSGLSGGELQRIYLARSLVRSPRLILLDEPAAGMDVTGESDFYEVLERVQKRHGATIIMVTHDWSTAAHHADRVLLLDRRLIGYGPPDEVLTESRLADAFGHAGHAHGFLHGHHTHCQDHQHHPDSKSNSHGPHNPASDEAK